MDFQELGVLKKQVYANIVHFIRGVLKEKADFSNFSGFLLLGHVAMLTLPAILY